MKVDAWVPVADESMDDCRDRETSFLWNENMSCKSAEEAREDLDDTQCELDCAGLHKWPTIDLKPTTIEVTREML